MQVRSKPHIKLFDIFLLGSHTFVIIYYYRQLNITVYFFFLLHYVFKFVLMLFLYLM